MPVADDALAAKAGTVELQHVACPRCGKDDSETVFRAEDYLYRLPGEYFASRCRACGLWFQNPRPVAARLADLYPERYGPHLAAASAKSTAATLASSQEGSWIRNAVRRLTWLRQIRRGWTQGYLVHVLGYAEPGEAGLLERVAGRAGAVLSLKARWKACVDLIPRFRADGRLLEVGSGNGSHLARLRSLGWKDMHGIELSAAAAKESRNLGFEVSCGAVEEVLARFPDRHFDTIISSMVLEHLLNPFETVRVIARKLKPDGEFLFSTVVRDSVDGRLFGKYGVAYDFPRHMVFFRKADLTGALAGEFECIENAHHNTPIDFWRPARLRGSAADGFIEWLFQLPGAAVFTGLLARLTLMGRVSFRYRRGKG